MRLLTQPTRPIPGTDEGAGENARRISSGRSRYSTGTIYNMTNVKQHEALPIVPGTDYMRETRLLLSC